MQLLSLNEIRSLHRRLPASQSPVAYAQAVVSLVSSWAKRTRRPYTRMTVDAGQVMAQWQALIQTHAEYDAAVQLAQNIESMVLAPSERTALGSAG